MKATYIMMVTACLTACTGDKAENAAGTGPVTEVTLTHAAFGHIPRKTILRATTVYQNKTVVSAPVPSYVSEIYVRTGKRVKPGELLYRLESKEQHALGYSSPPIEIRAAHRGIVIDVQAQMGSYVAEATPLCTLVETGSLAFEINVPYEQRACARPVSHCTLELPDGTFLPATVQAPLAIMDGVSQTEKVIATAAGAPFLPEGMNVKAVFTSISTSETVMLLPKAAVQSDETLSSHWVMRLADDSTAVSVPVETGNSTADSIEVWGPLTPDDRIILTGGYALSDSSKIVISHE